MIRTFFTACLMISIALPVCASEFVYDGPQLETNYDGPVLIDNSHFLFTNADMREFKIEQYLEQNAPNLLPIRPSISGWSAMHGIHPKILIHVLERYWNGAVTTNTKAEIDQVFQIATGLATVFWDEFGTPLAATQSVLAISNAYGLPTDIPSELALRRTIKKEPRAVDPFGYFQPPWTIGDTWAGGGAHGDTGSGTRNALDYWGASGDDWGDDLSGYWVAAMQEGTATVHAVCSITIDHDDGWRTTYYHLENPQISSGFVSRNTALANYANDLPTATCLGGTSTGPHVHSAVYHNGVRIEIDEANIDFTAFSHHAGVGQYDFDCQTSWFNHFTVGQVCPAYDQLLNNAPATDGLIFEDGFENGLTNWSSFEP